MVQNIYIGVKCYCSKYIRACYTLPPSPSSAIHHHCHIVHHCHCHYAIAVITIVSSCCCHCVVAVMLLLSCCCCCIVAVALLLLHCCWPCTSLLPLLPDHIQPLCNRSDAACLSTHFLACSALNDHPLPLLVPHFMHLCYSGRVCGRTSTK